VGIEVTTSQEYIYFGRLINLRVDSVRLPDGMPARREIVEHRDAVAIVAVDEEGRVLLVRQFRLATEQELYEIPAGIMEEGESPEETARRELAEETGQTAGTLRRLTGFYTSPGFCNKYLHIFLATDLHPAPATPDADEDISLSRVPLADALSMIDTGDLRDAKTITGLLLATRT
jgi:ADP-ribose pyrophosphatase